MYSFPREKKKKKKNPLTTIRAFVKIIARNGQKKRQARLPETPPQIEVYGHRIA